MESWKAAIKQQHFNANSIGNVVCSLATMLCLVLHNSRCMCQLEKQHNGFDPATKQQQGTAPLSKLLRLAHNPDWHTKSTL